VRVARAFTAYQHHSLVRTVARRAEPTTELLVAPNVAALYRDDDLAAWEREDLLAATLEILSELGAVLDCPVLLTSAGDGSDPDATAASETVADYAETEIECTRTREGLRLEDADDDSNAGAQRRATGTVMFGRRRSPTGSRSAVPWTRSIPSSPPTTEGCSRWALDGANEPDLPRCAPSTRVGVGADGPRAAPGAPGDFDRLFDRARAFADAAGYANPPEPERAFVLSLLLAHEVELRRLREELAALEDETDCDPRESRARDATGEADE